MDSADRNSEIGAEAADDGGSVHCLLVFGVFGLMKTRRNRFNLARFAAFLPRDQPNVSSSALRLCRHVRLAGSPPCENAWPAGRCSSDSSIFSSRQ